VIERDVNDLQTGESDRSTGGDQSSLCGQGPGSVAANICAGWAEYANVKVVLLFALTWSAIFWKVVDEIRLPTGGIVVLAPNRLPV
jgi:hypothetical protein